MPGKPSTNEPTQECGFGKSPGSTSMASSLDPQPRSVPSEPEVNLDNVQGGDTMAVSANSRRGRGGFLMGSAPPMGASTGGAAQGASEVNLDDNSDYDGSDNSNISDYHYDDDGKVVTTHHRARNDAERLSSTYMQMAHSFARSPSTHQMNLQRRESVRESNLPSPTQNRSTIRTPSNGTSQELEAVPATNQVEGSPLGASYPHNQSGTLTLGSSAPAPPLGIVMGSSAPLETDNESVMGESTRGQPRHVRRLAKAIKELSKEELIHISGLASLKAFRDVFSIRQYSGEAWYLPKTRKVKEGEARWGLGFSLAQGMQITFAGREVSIHVLSILIRVVMLVILWLAAWNALHPYQYLLEPGGYIFDPIVTVVVSALIGGVICRIVGIPPLVGVLWVAIMWRNIPLNPEPGSGDPQHMTDGIIAIERTIASRGGLTLILVRAGFSINVAALRPILPNALALGTLAMAVEGVVTSFVAEAIFGYGDWSWAFLQGFLCSVVSAAIVVPGTLMLQSEGYSKARGPLPQMLSSVGLETVLGVWCVNFMIGLMFDTAPLGLAIALGPIQIIVGVVIDILTGILFHFTVALVRKEATKLPTGKYTTTFTQSVSTVTLILFLSIAFTYVYAGNRLKLAGGGSVAAMVFSATVSHIWTGKSPFYDEQKKALGTGLADVWDLFVMPILFASTGSSVKLTQVFNSYFFPRGLACWAAGSATRALVATLTGLNTGLDWKEHVFLGVSWLGKAGIQSSLGGAALTRANAVLASTVAGTAEFTAAQRDVERATLIQSNAILYILICAPLGAVWVTKLGPILLKKDPPRQ